MITKVANCGDIHIPKKLERHDEYREVFEKFYQDLKKQKPDRIVITGDLYNDFIDLENEALILVGEFLTNLASISKVIVIKGNHDVRKKNKSRIDTIETVVTLLENPNIIYYKASGYYPDDNVVWVVWDYLDRLNPWKDIPYGKKDSNLTYIDLYHNPIIDVKLCNGYNFTKKNVPSITDLKGEVIAWSSAGTLGFKGTKKSTPYAANLVAKDCVEKAKKFNLTNIKVVVKGIGPGRESAIRGLAGTGINITSIMDSTPIAHNGVRLKKPRRV